MVGFFFFFFGWLVGFMTRPLGLAHIRAPNPMKSTCSDALAAVNIARHTSGAVSVLRIL